MMNNKKAGFLDWFLIIALFFTIAIVIIVATLVVNVVDATDIFRSTPAAQDALDSSKEALLALDNMMLFVIVGLSVFVLVSSALVNHHPAFFIVGFFLLCIAVTVSAIASNAFWIFSNTPQILSTANSYPKMTFLMNNFPIYIAFMGTAASVLMFISFRE